MVKLITDRYDLASDAFGGERMVVLSPGDRPRPRSLVVLVHGLAGSGYGTWRSIPEHLLKSEALDVDVAVLDYPVAWRLARTKPHLDDVVEGLFSNLQSLDYKSIVLVGHSMGGIVAASAVRLWGERLSPPTPVTRVAGLLYVASPRLGSQWPAPGRARRLLKIHADAQERNLSFFEEVDVTQERHGHQGLKIPSFAATADGDRFVKRISARIGVPVNQCVPLPGSHSTVLTTGSFRDWLVGCVCTAIRTHGEPARAGAPDTFTTQFCGDSANSHWEDAYDRVLKRFIDTTQIPVRHVGLREAAVGLRMRVVDAESVSSQSAFPDVARDVTDHNSGTVSALGVATFGTDAEAPHILRAEFGSAEARWFEGAATTGELESHMTTWLDRLTRNRMLERRNHTAHRRDLGTEGDLL